MSINALLVQDGGINRTFDLLNPGQNIVTTLEIPNNYQRVSSAYHAQAACLGSFALGQFFAGFISALGHCEALGGRQ